MSLRKKVVEKVNDYISHHEAAFRIVKHLETKHETPITPLEAYCLWRRFSDGYCAGFIGVSDDLLEEFVWWLNDKYR